MKMSVFLLLKFPVGFDFSSISTAAVFFTVFKVRNGSYFDKFMTLLTSVYMQNKIE